jgi:glycosyltransferase involved in cell wall biosynthesis
MIRSAARPKLSIVVPLFNEQDSVRPLYTAIVGAVDPLDIGYELIFVDDGSRDGTFAIAAELAADDQRLEVIKFRANFGQTPAMAAGIDHAVGEIIVTMDGDLQNDPQDIGTLIDKVEEGYDLVVGWRFNRQDKLVTRKIPSVIANWLIGKVTGVPIKDNGCSLKAFRASVIQNVALYSEMHRFIPAMASIVGPRIAEIKVRHHARQFGQSKYGLSRIYRVLLDLMIVKTVTSFSERPLLWFSLLAVPVIAAGLLFLAAGLVVPAISNDAIALPTAGSGMLMLALGFLLFLSGAFGELVFKTGDIRPEQFAALTMRHYPAASAPNEDER